MANFAAGQTIKVRQKEGRKELWKKRETEQDTSTRKIQRNIPD